MGTICRVPLSISMEMVVGAVICQAKPKESTTHLHLQSCVNPRLLLAVQSIFSASLALVCDHQTSDVLKCYPQVTFPFRNTQSVPWQFIAIPIAPTWWSIYKAAMDQDSLPPNPSFLPGQAGDLHISHVLPPGWALTSHLHFDRSPSNLPYAIKQFMCSETHHIALGVVKLKLGVSDY
jgi:hypothetical protein